MKMLKSRKLDYKDITPELYFDGKLYMEQYVRYNIMDTYTMILINSGMEIPLKDYYFNQIINEMRYPMICHYGYFARKITAPTNVNPFKWRAIMREICHNAFLKRMGTLYYRNSVYGVTGKPVFRDKFMFKEHLIVTKRKTYTVPVQLKEGRLLKEDQ